MKFKAKKRAILSDFEPFLTQKFAKKMFNRAMLSYRVGALSAPMFKFFDYLLFASTYAFAGSLSMITQSTLPVTSA